MKLTEEQIAVLRQVAKTSRCFTGTVGLESLGFIQKFFSEQDSWYMLSPVGVIVLDLLEQLEEVRDRHELLLDLYNKARMLDDASAALDQGVLRMSRGEAEAAEDDVSLAFDAWTAAKVAYEKAGGVL